MAPQEKYPELDSVNPCPKCGSHFGTVSTAGTPVVGEPELHYGCKSNTDSAGSYTVWDEWVRRTCPTCSFQWREAVWNGLDTE